MNVSLAHMVFTLVYVHNTVDTTILVKVLVGGLFLYCMKEYEFQ